MKKQAAFLILLALILSLTACGSGAISEPASTEPPQITVYAYAPSGWSDIGCWAWSSVEGKDAFEQWPGSPMEKVDKWHTIQVPGWIDHVIINADGGSVQTEDLPVEKGKDVWVVVKASGEATVTYEEPEIVPKEMVFFDSYNDKLPHIPAPESFLDVVMDGSGRAPSLSVHSFQYASESKGADIPALVESYTEYLAEYDVQATKLGGNSYGLYQQDVMIGRVDYGEIWLSVDLASQAYHKVANVAQKIGLNETAVSPSAEFTPKEIHAGKQVSAEDAFFKTTITCRDENKYFVWLTGDLHNLTENTVELQYNYYVYFIFDGFADYKAEVVATPMITRGNTWEHTWYAEIPKALLEECESLKVRVAFADQFDQISIDMEQTMLLKDSTLLCDIELDWALLNALKSFS